MKEMRERVVEVLAGMAGIPADQIDPQASFESLNLDSLDLVEMTLVIEDELGIKIGREDFEEVVTVQDAIDALEATARLSA